MYSQRKVVLNEKPVQVPESEDFKPSNPFKPLKPDYIHAVCGGAGFFQYSNLANTGK
jgi:hypothetical protein